MKSRPLSSYPVGKWLFSAAALIAAIMISWASSADEPPYKVALQRMLLCEGDVLAMEEEISGRYRDGHSSEMSVLRWGEAAAPTTVFMPSGGIQLFGAKAAGVVVSTRGSGYRNFQAYVFAEFVGDRRKAIDALKLVPGDGRTGEYVQRASHLDGDALCPPLVYLTPIANGRFLLGCGWCNG